MSAETEHAITKHTPGPWTAERMLIPSTVKDRRCGFVVNGPDVDEDFPVRVCDLRVPRGIDGFEEGQANAALIAAAPDLLAACKRALSILENEPANSIYKAHADIVRAAIAKAGA